MASTKKKSPAQSVWCACIFYPDNFMHMHYMNSLMHDYRYPYIFIRHKGERHRPALPFATQDDFLKSFDTVKDRLDDIPEGLEDLDESIMSLEDVSELQNPPKDHIHFLWNYGQRVTAAGAVRKSCGALKHIEIVRDAPLYAQYMLHADFKSVMLGKERYNLSDVKFSDPSIIAQLYLGRSDELRATTLVPIVLKASEGCTTARELVENLQRASMYNQYASTALDWVSNHSGFIRLLFPYFPASVADLLKLDKLNSLMDGSSYSEDPSTQLERK